MNDFMAQIDAATRDLKRGDLLEGKVIQAGDDHIIADIDYAQDGVIYEQELVEKPIDYAIGSIVKLIIIGFSKDGQVVLSEKKAQVQFGKAILEEALEKGSYFEGELKSIAKGGFRVSVSGVEGYLPFSLYQKNYLNAPEALLGTKTLLAIEKSDNRGYVFTRLPIEKEIYDKKKRAFYSMHQKGDIVKGSLLAFNRGGVVVDVEGIRGFIPRSEVSYSRQVKAEELIAENDMLTLVIRELSEKDEKLILSLKDLLENPWSKIEQEIQVGDVFDVKPTGQNDVLYFYELVAGVQGSLFKRKIPEEIIKSGEAHTVQVIAIDKVKKRVDLDYYFEVENYASDDQDQQSDNTLGNLFGDALKDIKFD